MDAVKLCSKGYFPENLPPVFTTLEFGNFVRNQGISNYLGLGKKDFGIVRYNASKRGHNRRIFGAPNPAPFLNMALFIEKNWSDITAHFEKSNFSLSIPKSSNSPAIHITPHKHLQKLKIKNLFSSKYLVTTDISRFYSTIYTHAIPWAVHGKTESKADRNWQSSTIMFNRLDYYCRMAQSGQTVGLPVGPDTSRIIAEILSVAIDCRFSEKAKGARALRHVDDVWIAANNEDEARMLLNHYRESVREFELDISEPKTKIQLCSKSFDGDWPVRIREKIEKIETFYINSSDIDDVIDLVSFVFGIAHTLGDEGPIRYAIRHIDKERSWGSGEQWAVLNKFLKTSVLSYSHSIDYVARIIAWKHRISGVSDKSEWVRLCNNIIIEHAPLNNESECVWSLWLLMEIKGKLRKDAFLKIVTHCDAFALVLAWYLFIEKRVSGTIDTTAISMRFRGDRFTGPNWLFVHEAVVRGWLTAEHFDRGADHEFLARLRSQNISFLNENAAPAVFAVPDDVDDQDYQPEYGIEDDVGGYDDDEEWEEDDDHEADDQFPF